MIGQIIGFWLKLAQWGWKSDVLRSVAKVDTVNYYWNGLTNV